MTSLQINADYLQMLMLKVRGIMGREGQVAPDPASNPTDDDAGVALERRPDDLSDDEVAKEIGGLSTRQQAELVALMWLGRGDGEDEEWEALVQRARMEISGPVENYLLQHPLLAEYWAEGLDRLDSSDDGGKRR